MISVNNSNLARLLFCPIINKLNINFIIESRLEVQEKTKPILMKKTAFLLLSLFAITSCEKETYVNYHVDNQSSNTINVVGTNIISATSINEEINPNVKQAVAIWSKKGKEIDFYEPITMFGDDLIITNASGDTLKKDYKARSNWGGDVVEDRATANHEYILVVTDADF